MKVFLKIFNIFYFADRQNAKNENLFDLRSETQNPNEKAKN